MFRKVVLVEKSPDAIGAVFVSVRQVIGGWNSMMVCPFTGVRAREASISLDPIPT